MKTRTRPAAPPPRVAAPDAAAGGRIVVTVDRTLYPLDAIYGASYVFLDRAYVFLEKGARGAVTVSLAGKKPLGEEGLRALAGEFVNELLNQSIRASLDESGRKIREYVVLKSHYGAAPGKMDLEELLDKTLKEAFDDDPLEIAVPWEEKYGQDEGKK
jgi:His-Xaa-Ser system protein HxsD